MTLVVTGGAGFIGTRVLDLIGDEWNGVALDNLHPQVHGATPREPELPHGTHFHRGDVANPAAWDHLLSRYTPRVVLHLAAETGTGQSLLEASRHTMVNVHGTAVMLDAFTRHNVLPEAIVLTSSRAVYGEGAWRTAEGEVFHANPRRAASLDRQDWLPRGDAQEVGVPVPHSARNVQARPSNVYASTKLAQEHLLNSWCSALGVQLTVLRLQNVYGRGQSLDNPYTGVLTFFARKALAGEPIPVYEGGGILRDFVSVQDVAEAVATALRRTAGPDILTADVGSGRPITLFEAAEVLASEAESAPPHPTNLYRLGDVRAAYADNSAAREALGYVPRLDFRDGVRELVAWVRENRAATPGHGA